MKQGVFLQGPRANACAARCAQSPRSRECTSKIAAVVC
jgi:hypothetical protein